jgi:thiamine-phosphate pyrophosphorylase
MKCDKKTMLLYAVTDRAWVGRQTLPQQVESALKGGATCVQLREKCLGEDAFEREALEIRELCRKYQVPLMINDNVEVAIRCGADGVHVGQSDMEAQNVRALVGESMILGVSAETVEQAVRAEKAGADYLGVGAVFPTATKLDATTVSRETFRDICSTVSIPVVAIGGINRQNIPELTGLGADGVALVSAIFSAADIESECRDLRALSEKMVASDR